MSIIFFTYILYLFKTKMRVSFKFELFYLFIYGILTIIVLFPEILKFIEKVLGVNSALNFIIYLSIFVAYFLIFLLYDKTEKQRQEITSLTREIAYSKNKFHKK